MILLLLKLETSSELVLFVRLMILNGLYYVLVVIQKPAHVPGYHFSHQWTSILEVFFFILFTSRKDYQLFEVCRSQSMSSTFYCALHKELLPRFINHFRAHCSRIFFVGASSM